MPLCLLPDDEVLGLHGRVEVGLNDGAGEEAPRIALRLSCAPNTNIYGGGGAFFKKENNLEK